MKNETAKMDFVFISESKFHFQVSSWCFISCYCTGGLL